MRNLKRALCLALSSVMLMGMMVVGAGASYSDVASTDNVEAIEVLQRVGIMTGDDKGNFNPKQNVTRNEMAVVMANLLDYNVAQYVGTAPFSDVPAWAEGYVAACYTHGIVAGTSKTTYSGDASVTAAQAALMVMKALGYFQYSSDFGDDWQLASIRQAARIDLFNKVSASVAEPMTRNDVAQIVLNALKATMVEPDDDTINVSTGDVTVQAGNIKYYQLVSSDGSIYRAIKDDEGIGMTNVRGFTIELGEKLYKGDLKLGDKTTDAFGRPGSKWTYKTNGIGSYADKPDGVFTGKMSKDALYDLLGKDVVKDYALNVFTDGVATASEDGISTTYAQSGSSSASCGTGKGMRTEVFIDNDADVVTVCIINTYVAQATADFNSNKGSLNVEALTAPVGMSLNSLSDEDFKLSSYADEDYILYTASKMGGSWSVESIAPAKVVSGEVNAYSVKNYVTIDGTKYEYAEKIETNSAATEYVVGNDAAVVLDATGFVIYVDDASISSGNYLYLNVTAPASGLSSKFLGEVYFTDGVNEEVTVKTIKNAAGAAITLPNERSEDFSGWYSYSKDSQGRYTLQLAKTSADNNSTTSITNNKASFAAGVAVTGNSSTVFVVKDKKDNVTVYTGISKVPEINGNVVFGYMKSKDDSAKAASLVFVDASNATVKNAATESLLYTLKLNSTYVDSSDNEKVYTWTVILDGKEVKVDTKENWVKGVLYEDYAKDSDGYYEIGSEFDTTDGDKEELSGVAEISYSDGVLSVAGTPFVVSDTQIVLVMAPETKGEGELSNVIMGDNNADYELATPSARSLANLFKGYDVTGTIYVVYDDKDSSDLVTTLYVVVTAAEASV